MRLGGVNPRGLAWLYRVVSAGAIRRQNPRGVADLAPSRTSVPPEGRIVVGRRGRDLAHDLAAGSASVTTGDHAPEIPLNRAGSRRERRLGTLRVIPCASDPLNSLTAVIPLFNTTGRQAPSPEPPQVQGKHDHPKPTHLAFNRHREGRYTRTGAR